MFGLFSNKNKDNQIDNGINDKTIDIEPVKLPIKIKKEPLTTDMYLCQAHINIYGDYNDQLSRFPNLDVWVRMNMSRQELLDYMVNRIMNIYELPSLTDTEKENYYYHVKILAWTNILKYNLNGSPKPIFEYMHDLELYVLNQLLNVCGVDEYVVTMYDIEKFNNNKLTEFAKSFDADESPLNSLSTVIDNITYIFIDNFLHYLIINGWLSKYSINCAINTIIHGIRLYKQDKNYAISGKYLWNIISNME